MTRRKRWGDLTVVQRAAIVLLGTVQLMLLAAALRDIHRRSPREISGSKYLWIAVIFVNFIGPIAYFLLGRKDERTICWRKG